MDHFCYKDGRLLCEAVPVEDIVRHVGTPTYIYSKATLLTHYERIAQAFSPLNPIICYSIKSCGNLEILRSLRQQGSGFDVVSGGELFRALRAGADAGKIVFAGVGKSDQEINEALEAGIGLFNIESEEEFWNLDRLAAAKRVHARCALRVNPDVASAGTHAKTLTGKKETKFGVDIDRAGEFYRQARRANNARLCGLHLHIGSPIKTVDPYVSAITKALALIDQLGAEGIVIDTLDIGGGFAAFYEGNEAPPAATYAQAIVPLLAGRGLNIILEPGRSIACNAGILVTRVQYTKAGGSKRFIIVDAAMNDLIRPTLYESYHFIWPTNPGAHGVPANRLSTLRTPEDVKVDVVGPVCESGDYLAKERHLPVLKRGDLLAVFSAGAYGFAMSSQYNARPRAAEVLVDGSGWHIIRRRETYEDLIAGES
ncbi:MAG: diaminopimelate decarboxylase [Phycisphaerales bacterium]|nr:diaminopimelate decarboxylase [Phycisphaerales bacterium]